MPVAFGEPPAISHQPSADSTMLLHSARTLYDDGVLLRNGLSLHKLAPGGFAGLSKNDAKRLDVTDGDTVAVNGVSLSVRVDDSLLDGVVHVPFNQPGTESVGDGLNVDVRVVREGDES
jgi:predicted molibdopterin-dependent oxidoreductase YjgC